MDVSLPEPDILLEQGACLVVNKPVGVLTQAPPGIDSMEQRIKAFLKVRENKPGKVYVGVPHRLDRPVSGAMVFVRNVRAAKRVAAQFQQRTVEKTYWAIVAGVPDGESGTWTDWMRKVPDEARSEIVDPGKTGAQQAILHYQAVATTGQLTWLEIQLETGRTHQIRLQCGHRGLSILGDQLYGSQVDFGPQTLDLRRRGIALHARRLSLNHPMASHRIDQKAPLPSFWRELSFEFGD